jgi:hypothetical protein
VPLVSPSTSTSTSSRASRLSWLDQSAEQFASPDSSGDFGLTTSSSEQSDSRERLRSSRKNGLKTTGENPIERFGAALVLLGRRLAVVGGLTVEEGMESASGMVYDEFCVRISHRHRLELTVLQACHVSAIDIFDTVRHHWTTIRPLPSSHESLIPLGPDRASPSSEFFKETIAFPLPPSESTRFWSILIFGKALDLRGYHIESSNDPKSRRGSAHDQPRDRRGSTAYPIQEPTRGRLEDDGGFSDYRDWARTAPVDYSNAVELESSGRGRGDTAIRFCEFYLAE